MPDQRTLQTGVKNQSAGRLPPEALQKIRQALLQSRISDEDKKWWLVRLASLNEREAKQLWRIFHANQQELKQIVTEEKNVQIKLKKELDEIVRKGTMDIYHLAEEEENKVDQAELQQLMATEGIL